MTSPAEQNVKDDSPEEDRKAFSGSFTLLSSPAQPKNQAREDEDDDASCSTPSGEFSKMALNPARSRQSEQPDVPTSATGSNSVPTSKSKIPKKLTRELPVPKVPQALPVPQQNVPPSHMSLGHTAKGAFHPSSPIQPVHFTPSPASHTAKAVSSASSPFSPFTAAGKGPNSFPRMQVAHSQAPQGWRAPRSGGGDASPRPRVDRTVDLYSSAPYPSRPTPTAPRPSRPTPIAPRPSRPTPTAPTHHTPRFQPPTLPAGSAICPSTLYRDQPSDGTMAMFYSFTDSLSGHENTGTYIIRYSFPAGVQQAKHPSPGTRYEGTERLAYLPDTKDGRKVLMLFKTAFDRGLVFTMGTSLSTGREGVVWSGIHHKTSQCGGQEANGYPDPDYLSKVQKELAEMAGVTEKDLTGTQKLFIEKPQSFVDLEKGDFSSFFIADDQDTFDSDAQNEDWDTIVLDDWRRSENWRHITDEDETDGWTSLHLACYYNRVQDVDKYVDTKADQSKAPTANNDDETINPTNDEENMQLTANQPEAPTTLKLIKYEYPPSNINTQTEEGETPLFLACEQGHLGVVRKLLRYKNFIDINLPDKRGKTPLSIAEEKGYSDVVRELQNFVGASKSL